MKIISLTAEEREQTGFTHKAIISYADIPAGTGAVTNVICPSATPGNSTPGTLSAGMAITKAAFYLATQFASGTLSALTASLGDGGSATQYIGAQSVLSGATPVTWAMGAASGNKIYTSTDQLKVTFTPTGGNTNTLTAGELDVLFKLEDLNAFTLTV
jgi:hypothetical protein